MKNSVILRWVLTPAHARLLGTKAFVRGLATACWRALVRSSEASISSKRTLKRYSFPAHLYVDAKVQWKSFSTAKETEKQRNIVLCRRIPRGVFVLKVLFVQYIYVPTCIDGRECIYSHLRVVRGVPSPSPPRKLSYEVCIK